MHFLESSAPSATIVCPFPGSPEPCTAGLRLHTKYHMTASDLREVRRAVTRLPLPWFSASEELNTDSIAGHRWTASRIAQVAGPPIANFCICKDGTAGYLVDVSDDCDMIAEWHGFPTTADAVAAIWAHTVERLDHWGLVAA